MEFEDADEPLFRFRRALLSLLDINIFDTQLRSSERAYLRHFHGSFVPAVLDEIADAKPGDTTPDQPSACSSQ
jgi:hypothetical protein